MEGVSSWTKRVHVVPHTHWDREWYATFATFRTLLVPLVDGLMDLLERHPEFRSFTFDGQVAPIDDYLDARPPHARAAAEKRLRALIAEGRIIIGPWYTLSDQFLVSGETTLRNLERGMSRAQELGGFMDIAYCPDQFGLMAELPKVLRHAGLTKVVGDRGIRKDFPERFTWKALDGSAVEMLNLKDGYNHPHQGKLSLYRLAMRRRGRPGLFMAGFDHSVPKPSLATRVVAVGARMSSLPEYWRDLPPVADEQTHLGELRSEGARNLLPNVVSNRIDQRLVVAQAERLLERYAEPLAALFHDVYPRRELETCWTNQIWNAAHDSACATGIDEVTTEVMGRAQNVIGGSKEIASRALQNLSPQLQYGGEYVWNPSNFERDFSLPSGKEGFSFTAREVPPLGWARLQLDRSSPKLQHLLPMRFTDQADRGDTYTFVPGGLTHSAEIPYQVEQRPGEPFSRIHVQWDNRSRDHRVRLLLKLPEIADKTVADTAFGIVSRPALPDGPKGRDRLNGYPAGKFTVAGGVAVLLDRIAEYELLPESNELAITLVRSHGRLARFLWHNRLGAAGPRLRTEGTQMQGTIAWDLAVMPWSDGQRMPWREWEQFMLPPLRFTSAGGGTLPERGTLARNLPEGVLSAVLPDRVRAFQPQADYRIVEAPLEIRHASPPQVEIS